MCKLLYNSFLLDLHQESVIGKVLFSFVTNVTFKMCGFGHSILYLHIYAIDISLFFRWYFGKIKRVEAEKKLLSPENEHGAYLIRDSESRRNDYSLSGIVH